MIYKLLLPISLILSCFWNAQVFAENDVQYPAYNFEPNVVYQSPELQQQFARAKAKTNISVDKTINSQQKLASAKPKNIRELPPVKPLQSAVVDTEGNGSFEIYLLPTILLVILGYVFRDKLIDNARVHPLPKSKTPAKPAPKSSSTIISKNNKQTRPIKKSTPKPAGILNYSENATQCQASTAKGSQCNRTANLTQINRTINKQKYRFSVCNQHNNQSFKPYQSLIKQKTSVDRYLEKTMNA